MRIEYRKKHPYFGKYKAKISIYNGRLESRGADYQGNVKRYLEANYNTEEFKWSGGWNVYLKDESIAAVVDAAFPDYICYLYKPAPGYEDLEGLEENTERVLWYEKYPYKMILSVGRATNFEQLEWCEDNIEGHVKTSAGSAETSFYFMNSFNAMAFKLAFSDIVVKTYVANPEKAAILLEERMETAAREYHEYLEGENHGQ